MWLVYFGVIGTMVYQIIVSKKRLGNHPIIGLIWEKSYGMMLLNLGDKTISEKLNEDVVKGWRDGIPLKRGGSTEDVANACLFFASDMSAYVTGQVLNVCGGMLT